MEKSYKKSCKSAIYALAIIVAGACTLAQPAFGLSCFLPSGNCGGGGIDIKNQDDCSKYTISKEKYETEYMNNCWSCSGCNDKQTNKTTYSCTLKTGSDLFDTQSFVLPVEMKIVTTYKVPYVYRGGDCRLGSPIITWNQYDPQTVTLTIPKGSKLGTNISAIAKDFAGNHAVSENHFYIDGKERSRYTDTVNNIIYRFQEL